MQPAPGGQGRSHKVLRLEASTPVLGRYCPGICDIVYVPPQNLTEGSNRFINAVNCLLVTPSSFSVFCFLFPVLTMYDENVVNLSAQCIDNIQNCCKSMKDDESFSSSNVKI